MKIPQTRREASGFTLVEIMVVVVILGILAATIILNHTRPGLKGRLMGPYAILQGGLAPLGSLVATRLTFWFGGHALIAVGVLTLSFLIYVITRPAWRQLGKAGPE